MRISRHTERFSGLHAGFHVVHDLFRPHEVHIDAQGMHPLASSAALAECTPFASSSFHDQETFLTGAATHTILMFRYSHPECHTPHGTR